MKPCCQKPENRNPPEDLGNGLTVQTCKVCGRRHFELEVDPVEVGIKLS